MATIQDGGVSWATYFTPNAAKFQLSTVSTGWSVLVTGPTEGGFWYQQDCTNASRAQAQLKTVNASDGSSLFTNPDNSHRWGLTQQVSWLTTALPSGNMIVFDHAGASGSYGLRLNSGGVFLIVDQTGLVIGSGSTAISPNTQYLLDWRLIIRDASGATLTTGHIVLGIYSSPYGGGAATLVDTVQAYTNNGYQLFTGLNLGDGTSTNLGCAQNFGTVTMCIEDAAAPAGQFRSAWYKPTGAGSFTTYSSPNANQFAAINVLPPPLDSQVNGTNKNYIQGQNGNHDSFATTGQTVNTGGPPSASDTPYWLMFGWRDNYTPTKGSTQVLGEPSIYDGTNTLTRAALGNNSGAGAGLGGPYNDYFTTFTTNAAGGAWSMANLPGGAGPVNEIGLINSSTGGNQYVDAVHGFFAWVKSGETISAPPGPDVRYVPMQAFVGQSVKRAATY